MIEIVTIIELVLGIARFLLSVAALISFLSSWLEKDELLKTRHTVDAILFYLLASGI